VALTPFPEEEILDHLTQAPIVQVLTVSYRVRWVWSRLCSGTLHPGVSVGDAVIFLLNPWYDFRYMTSTPQGPTTAFGKNPMANKNPKQNITKEIKS